VRSIGLIAACATALALTALAGCATIPARRYGVAEVHVEGLSHLDHGAAEACLGTRRRPQFGLDVPASPPDCGTPPFDGSRWRLDFFAWPWTDWPLFDASVWERDRSRMERWLRARGYYDARVVSTTVDPPAALTAGDEASQGDQCGQDGQCEVRATITVEEGEPVRVVRVELHGIDDVDETLHGQLRQSLRFRHDDIFDEALYEESRRQLLHALADASYVDATVQGTVKIDAPRHEAYVAFDVVTGQPGVVGRVCVVGNGPLPPAPIVGATLVTPGQRFSLSSLEEAQRAIYALGTFSSVEIRHRHPVETEVTHTEGTDETGALVSTDTSGVPNPEPIVEEGEGDASGADASATPDGDGDGAGDADGDGDGAAATPHAAPQPTLCVDPDHPAPPGHRVVDLEIRVAPGRLTRVGLGLGIQAGNTLQFGGGGSLSTTQTSQSQNQWDFHGLLVLEDRNLFGQMLRARVEERPRIIFTEQFPGGEPRPGNQIVVGYRWPGFLEPRTVLFASLQHDYGPAPIVNFFRHELDGRLGLERTFFDGHLYLSGLVRGNFFFPDQDQGVRVHSRREATQALILQATAYLDLRDNPRTPTQGVYFGIDFQGGGFGGVSSWDYVRVTADARGYVPLPAGIVLAARFAIGVTEVLGTYGLDRDNVYDLAQLGPFSEQLVGGGSVSNRGYPAGYLGDVERRAIESRPYPGGGQPVYQPVTISGGNRRWEASLELRIPITQELGFVLFADAGDVTRTSTFRFNVPQISPGFGLRLRTVVGTIRFDWGFRPDILQVIGLSDPSLDPRGVACTTTLTTACRPVSNIDLGVPIPSAIHLTIGEAF
jgi:outer membrane translocation and assembly module TamA